MKLKLTLLALGLLLSLGGVFSIHGLPKLPEVKFGANSGQINNYQLIPENGSTSTVATTTSWGGHIWPQVDNQYDIGTSTKRWRTGYFGSIVVGSCTGCGSGSGTDTLLDVTNRGSIATSSLTLFGGITTSDITATGTTALQGLTFTNATGTNTTSTNLAFTSASGSSLLLDTITVSGQSVCLADGTDCPAGSGTPSWQQTLAVDNIATSSFLTYGNATTSNLAATGTLDVVGQTILADTSISAFTTGLFPNGDNTLDLGSAALSWSDLHVEGSGTIGTVVSSLVSSPASFFQINTGGFVRYYFSDTEFRAFTTDSIDIGTPSISWANIYASGTAVIGTDVTVGGSSVCLANGTNCPSSFAALTVTDLTVRNILDISGGLASSTLVLSGRSGEIGATAPIPTSTQLTMNGFPRTLPAMNATNTNCIYYGPEFIRDAWNGGTMKPTLQWLAATGTGNILWSLQAQSVASGTYYGQAFSGAKSYATGTAFQGFFGINNAMTDLTVGSAATGTAMKFALCREGGHAQDTFGADAYPDSLKIEYAVNSYSD